MDFLNSELFESAFSFLYFLEAMGLLFLAKLVFDRMAQFNVKEQLIKHDNLAFIITYAGYFIGMGIILVAVLKTDSEFLFARFQEELAQNLDNAPLRFLSAQLMDTGVYGLLGMLCLLCSRIMVDRWLLSEIKVRHDIIEAQNTGTGIIVASIYIASSLIIAAAMQGGLDQDLLLVVLYFLVGQVFLALFGRLYVRFLPYSLTGEIHKGNTAPALAYGATLIAVSIFLSKGLSFEWQGTVEFLWILLEYSLSGLFLFPLIRWIFDKVIFGSLNITHELIQDRNLGIGLLEGIVVLLMSLFFYHSF